MNARTLFVAGTVLVCSAAGLSAQPGSTTAPAVAAAPAPPPVYTLPLADRWRATLPDGSLGRAAGFYYGRLVLAERMLASQPGSEEAIKLALRSFTAQFEPAYHAVHAELTRRDSTWPKAWEERVVPQLRDRYKDKQWTAEEVEAAAKTEFSPKTQPAMERALLCSMHPAYWSTPMNEYLEGYTVRSVARIQGDSAHQFVFTHPVSWGNVGGKDSPSLFLASALGAGPLVFKVDAVHGPDTAGAVTPDGLKGLMQKYGPQGGEGITMAEITLTPDQSVTMREVRGTVSSNGQTVRTIGRYLGTM